MGQLVTGRTHGRGKAVSDPQAGSLGSLQACEGQPGAAGVDGQSIDDFEANLSGNLYKLWNQMSSGSHFPPPVRASTFRKQVVASGRWAFQRSPTALLRKSLADISSRSWSRCFTRTPLAIGPANLRLMPWRKPASAAGATTVISFPQTLKTRLNHRDVRSAAKYFPRGNIGLLIGTRCLSHGCWPASAKCWKWSACN